jgi:glycosyltransferase involved in cell wall biosynthesis
MMVMLVALGVATLLEICLGLSRGIWLARSLFIPLIVILLSFATGGMVASNPSIAAGLIMLTSAYRIFNLLRIVQGRMNEKFLQRATQQTSLWLIGAQAILLGVWWLVMQAHLQTRVFLLLLVVVQFITALVLALSTFRQFRKTQPMSVNKSYADRDLPTVTVAIPARNEDQQLEACLRSVLDNDYLKLEVLVLDDCSQDRTSQIIRNFAHEGVRFIPGKVPKGNWLAKNQAYEQLAKEASGELILFCGVDVRFAPQSIKQMVTILTEKKKRMLTIMPINDRPVNSYAQVIRYFWELALPRRMFNRPPVLSSCWLIDAKFLEACGGFAAVNNSITPEAHFARAAVKDDAYSFILSTAHMGVVSVKSADEQQETAIRVRYPQLHRRPELVLLLELGELVLLLLPYVLAIIGFWGVFGVTVEVILIITCTLLIATYRSITFATSPVNNWYMAPLLPLALLYDVVLLNYSMGKYEFSTVEWKGRNICVPVMRVLPKLPEN